MNAEPLAGSNPPGQRLEGPAVSAAVTAKPSRPGVDQPALQPRSLKEQVHCGGLHDCQTAALETLLTDVVRGLPGELAMLGSVELDRHRGLFVQQVGPSEEVPVIVVHPHVHFGPRQSS